MATGSFAARDYKITPHAKNAKATAAQVTAPRLATHAKRRDVMLSPREKKKLEARS